MKFTVLRHHTGDRTYLPGETREAAEVDVAHLVKAGVLEKKAEPAPKNKAEDGAPQNKAAVEDKPATVTRKPKRKG